MSWCNFVQLSMELRAQKATGERGPATMLELGTYALIHKGDGGQGISTGLCGLRG